MEDIVRIVSGALLFSLAFFFVIGAMGARRLDKWRRERAWLREPGRMLERPRVVSGYSHAEDIARSARCRCGGLLDIKAEGTAKHDGREVHVIRLQCTRCERAAALYFEIGQ